MVWWPVSKKWRLDLVRGNQQFACSTEEFGKTIGWEGRRDHQGSTAKSSELIRELLSQELDEPVGVPFNVGQASSTKQQDTKDNVLRWTTLELRNCIRRYSNRRFEWFASFSVSRRPQRKQLVHTTDRGWVSKGWRCGTGVKGSIPVKEESYCLVTA